MQKEDVPLEDMPPSSRFIYKKKEECKVDTYDLINRVTALEASMIVVSEQSNYIANKKTAMDYAYKIANFLDRNKFLIAAMCFYLFARMLSELE